MKSFTPLLIASLFWSPLARAQSALEVREDELATAAHAQLMEESRAEKIQHLFEKLSAVHSIEIELGSQYRFSSSPRGVFGKPTAVPVFITFNNGNEIAGITNIGNSKTACSVTLQSLVGCVTSEKGSRIKLSLHSLDRFDLTEQRVFAATWTGNFVSPKGEVMGNASMECTIGWVSLGSWIEQPEELSVQVIQYNLGVHARIFRTAAGDR